MKYMRWKMTTGDDRTIELKFDTLESKDTFQMFVWGEHKEVGGQVVKLDSMEVQEFRYALDQFENLLRGH